MIKLKNRPKLADVTRKAINDSVITVAECEEINSVASQDGVIDALEKALLREWNTLISDKTVKLGKHS